MIGIEYASMFAALASDVHVVEPRAPVLPFLDGEIVERMSRGMESLGVPSISARRRGRRTT